MRTFLGALLVVCVMESGAFATTWYVKPDGTGDSPTIQSGIDLAASGDTVLLADGTFTGGGNRNIQFGGKTITLRSESGDPESCIIDCERATRGMELASGVTLEGLTLANGIAEDGGGVICGGSPTIRNCRFVGNVGESSAGAIYFNGGTPIVADCVFEADSAYGSGGAIRLASSSPTFERCVFSHNWASSGGAVVGFAGTPSFLGCTFSGNSAITGGGFYLNSGNVVIESTIVAFSPQGEAIYCTGGATVAVNCSDIFGNAGGDWTGCIAGQEGINGNLSVDPGYCDSANGDFTLSNISPCLSPNNSCGVQIGAYGQGCEAAATPIAYWPLDEMAGDTAHDATGNDHHGVIYGASWVSGVDGSALEFDGLDDYVAMTDGTWLTQFKGTVEAWVKIHPDDIGSRFISNETAGCGNGLFMNHNAGGIMAGIHSDGDCVASVSIDSVLKDEWHFVAFVWDGDTNSLLLFVDGDTSTVISGGHHGVVNTGEPLTLGCWENGELRGAWFRGWLDEVKLYDTALSVDELNQHYGALTLTTNIVGHGYVTKTPDKSTYAPGDTVIVEAIPDPCWEFVGWSDGLSGAMNPDTVVMVSDTTVTATFTQYTFTLTADAVGSGDVTRSPDQPNYLCGDTVYVEAIPDPCWEFTGWSGGLSGAENPDTIVMLSDTTVMATFIQKIVTLIDSVVGSGSISKTPDQPNYLCGDTVYVEALPENGWTFGGWSHGLSGNENPDTMVMVVDTILTAIFMPDTVTINVTTNPVGLGVVVDSVAYETPRMFAAAFGDSHQICVDSPQELGDTIYTFLNWSDGGAQCHSIVVPDSDVTYTANFVTYFKFPIINFISDIPDDQGGWARMHIARSAYDSAEEEEYPVATYNVWRRVDDIAMLESISDEGEILGPEKASLLGPTIFENPEFVCNLPLARWDERLFFVQTGQAQLAGFPPGTWEIVESFAAVQLDNYVQAVPTLGDSTETGIAYTIYAVSAHTTTPSVWFMSPRDSGYSVDNIAPGVPTGFEVAYRTGSGNHLSWNASPAPDFQYFKVYRGTSLEFVPAPQNQVDATAGTEWTDAEYDSGGVYYKITALDHVGNESDPASFEPATGVGDHVIPKVFALYQNVPNPFNPTTVIRYDVPVGGGKVTLRVFDVSGKIVRTLVDEVESSGEKTVQWNGRNERGEQVSTGVYFYRLAAGNRTLTKKMVFLK